MAIEDFDMTAFGEGLEFVDEETPGMIHPPIEEDGETPDNDQEDKDDKNDTDPEKEESVGKNKQVEDPKDEDPKDKDDSSDDEGSSSQKLYSSLASALAEEGIITSLENIENIKTPEDLFKAIKEEIKKNEFADLTEEQKAYLEAVRTGVQPQVYNDYQTVLKQLETVTEAELKENVELRKGLMVQDFVNQGISKEKAEKLAQRSIDLGEDVEDSKEALASLKAATKAEYEKMLADQQKARLDAEKETQRQLKQLKDDLFKTNEIIPGLKINEGVKQKVYEQMTKTVGKSEKTGQPLNALTQAREKDPIGFTIKMHYLFNLTNGFSDFTKLTQKVKSNAVKQLENTLRKTTDVNFGGNSNAGTEFEIDDNLKTVLDNL